MGKQLTLVYIRHGGKVLLGLKKRGFGAGKYNGFGGKIKGYETPEECGIREVGEESGIKVKALRYRGLINYTYDSLPYPMAVYVYDVPWNKEEPIESEEMKPIWFDESNVPLEKMWADDEHWLREMFSTELTLEASFRFEHHEGPRSYNIIEKTVAWR